MRKKTLEQPITKFTLATLVGLSPEGKSEKKKRYFGVGKGTTVHVKEMPCSEATQVFLCQESVDLPLLFQVHALYDFDGQPGTEELSIRCGEVLVVTNTNIGEGWWEGHNAAGQSGLFPEAYVEVGVTNRYWTGTYVLYIAEFVLAMLVGLRSPSFQLVSVPLEPRQRLHL